jgi:hypothetical protein
LWARFDGFGSTCQKPTIVEASAEPDKFDYGEYGDAETVCLDLNHWAAIQRDP